MATAEIAPVVSSATQGPPGVSTAFDDSVVGNGHPLQGVVLSPVPVGMGATVEIAVEAEGAKLSVTLVDEVPSARPGKSVLFAGRLGPDLRLLKPIPLDVSLEEGQVVLTWAETDDFACGDNTGEALDHFGQSIRELYEHLHADEVALGVDLLRVRDVLDRYITARTK
jgi:hypothetical protein